MSIKRPKLKITWPTRNDLPAMVDIYNQAIRSGVATGHTKEYTNWQHRWGWYKNHNRMTFPLYMMTYEKKVIGYGTLSPYRQGRQAMRNIAEVAFFIDEKYQGKGYGKILLQYIINDCERVKIKALIAVLLDINKRSIRLLKKFAFKKWGHFPEVIEFEDKTCGQLIYGKKITEDDYVDLIFL
jgi:L-amino acid N-acyltransferase YncA